MKICLEHKYVKYDESLDNKTGQRLAIYFCDYCGKTRIIPIIDLCEKALDYVIAVSEKQERLLDFDTLYTGYKVTIGGLTREGFEVVYSAYKETYNRIWGF